jgi:hypothetical protein
MRTFYYKGFCYEEYKQFVIRNTYILLQRIHIFCYERHIHFATKSIKESHTSLRVMHTAAVIKTFKPDVCLNYMYLTVKFLRRRKRMMSPTRTTNRLNVS